MEYISDILLGAGALAAAFYCVILSRKLNRLSGLDQELGTAIALLSQQVDEMTSVLQGAQAAADGARNELEQVTGRAEALAAELKVAATPPTPEPAPPPVEITPEPEVPLRDSGGLKDGAPSLFVRHSSVAS